MSRICVLFDRLGPYHRARLNAAGALFPTVGLELSGETSDYAWEKVKGQGTFERRTLFPGEDSHARPASEVARRLHKTLDEQQPAAVAIPGWSEKGALAALSWCLQAGRPAIMMSESKRSDAERHWPKEMTDSLLMSDVDIEIADHHNATEPPYAFFATTELAGFHVAFQDVDAIFLIE